MANQPSNGLNKIVKAVKNGTASATSKQTAYYELLTEAAGAKASIPAGTDRQSASDLIDQFLTANPSLRGRSLKQLQGLAKGGGIPKVTPAKAPAAKPAAPKPASKMQVYPWPPVLPAIPAECLPYQHLVVKADDPEMLIFKPRTPYWDWLCDAHFNGRFMQLVGEPGCGKSVMEKALAYVTQVPYLPISCDGKLNPRTLFGQISIKNGTSFFTEGEVTKLTQVPSVIVLEERNGLDGSVEMTFNRMLNNREFFIPEANGGQGQLYKLHPKCYIVQDCNPPGAKFTGAQKQNVATVDRVSVMKVPMLTRAEIIRILDNHKDAGRMADFYLQAADMIKTNGFRCSVTLRGLKRATVLIDTGYTEKDSIELGVLNAIELTGGQDAFAAVQSVAKGMFKA
jgi:dynein-related subfamily AAA family protein